MKRNLVVITLMLFVVLSITALSIVQAQDREPESATEPTSQCPCMKGETQGGMMGGRMGGMMGGMQQGMMSGMRGGMMGGMEPGRMGVCPMRVPEAKVDVRTLDNGVTIAITAEDAKAVRRIQRSAAMMRLMHEMESEK